MRYAIPVVALFGLVCLALTPVPVVWGLVVALVSLALIVAIMVGRWLDAALLAVLRRHGAGGLRRRGNHARTGIAQRGKRAGQAA